MLRMTYEELELEVGERKTKTEGHGVAFVTQPRLFKSFSATESVKLRGSGKSYLANVKILLIVQHGRLAR